MKWYCEVHNRECPDKKGCPPEAGGILLPCRTLPLMRYRQSARPFIVFPLDNSTEGWIKVASELETMINYLIEQKTELVHVGYIDRRIDGEIENPRDYGLAVEALKEPYFDDDGDDGSADFLGELLQRPLPDGASPK